MREHAAVRILGVMVVVLACLPAVGCFSYIPGVRSSGPSSSIPWPNRDESGIERLAGATPERIYRARMVAGASVDGITDPNVRELVTKPRFIVTGSEIVHGMLVRTYRHDDPSSPLSVLINGFVPNGRVLSPRDLEPNRRRLSLDRAARMRAKINTRLTGDGVEVDPTGDEAAIEEGVAFRIPESFPSECRGVVLHLWALSGNKYERRIAEEFESRRWLVVDVKPRTVAPPDLDGPTVDRILELERQREDLEDQVPRINPGESAGAFRVRRSASAAYRRQREIDRCIVDLRSPPLRVCEEADIGPVAESIAARIDAALVDNAYAARAVLETVRRIHPGVRGLPVLVMGFSAGAISTPTVAALLKPDGVIMVGGGANILGIADSSELTNGGIRLTCGSGRPSPGLVRALEGDYLERSRFDPYRAAPALASVPTLVVDAGLDTWVPARFGELLRDRLGKPDRLHMALGGHAMLFYFLPGRAKWIADWAERAVRSTPESPAAQGLSAR